ncbi:MAG: putative quinol monooxygenase [Woeseiaceae bacterium]|nr:putative quinol monooxygenase [Woeseiaceae bacterium]
MYVVVVIFEVKHEHTAEFLQAVLRQAENSLDREDACRVFDVCADPQDPCAVLLYEQYDNAAAFDAHLASEHFRTFDATVTPWLNAKTVSTWQLRATHS